MTPSPSPTIDAIVAATPAPWWGVPVVAGIFLLLGAVLGYVFNLFNERRRERREDSRKWLDELRVEAAQLVTLAHRIDLDAPDLDSARKAMEASDDIELSQDYLNLSEPALALMTELYLVNSTIKIIAPERVVVKSGRLVNSAGVVMSGYSKERSNNLSTNIGEFLKEVRYTLHIDPERPDGPAPKRERTP